MINTKKVKEIVNITSRLGFVPRYSTLPTMVKQTVSAHTAKASILAFLISKYVVDKGVELDPFKVAVATLFHDMEETKLGDIILTIKRDTDIGKAYDRMAREFYDELLGELEPEILKVLNGSSVEFVVHKFADRFEGFLYSFQEYMTFGNREFDIVVRNYYDELGRLSDDFKKETGNEALGDFLVEFAAPKFSEFRLFAEKGERLNEN